jgi:hypothetical protein|tara:strand:+ start:1478 stop:1780 length:303 start_codon:yes stop_codon:yes gene_type:complete
MKEKNKTNKIEIAKGLAKLVGATALGVFVYESFRSDEEFYKRGWELYRMRLDGDYLGYAKELFVEGSSTFIHVYLVAKALYLTIESCEHLTPWKRKNEST